MRLSLVDRRHGEGIDIDTLAWHLARAQHAPFSYERAWHAGYALGLQYRLGHYNSRVIHERITQAREIGAIDARGPEDALASVDQTLTRQAGTEVMVEACGLLSAWESVIA